MKWFKALLGLAVIGAFVYGVLLIKGKPGEVPVLPILVAPVTVEKGTQIPLVLVTPLESGGSAEGKEVKLVVAEDVKGPNGKTVIEQGALATGKVVKSRSGSLAGTLTNKPARLEIELVDVVSADGHKVKIQGPEGEKAYAFDQANTKIDESPNLVDAVTDPKARDTVVAIARQLASGEEASPEEKKKADDQLKNLAEKYGLKDTQSFIEGSKDGKSTQKTDLSSVIQSVQKGDIKGLSGVDVLLAARAAGEIINLGSGIDKSLRGIFKGSNIRARVGLPVKAYVAEESKIRPK